MNNDWIIDVLRDLKKFSSTNELENLAEHLDDTIMIAMSELASKLQSAPKMVGDFEQVGRYAGSPQAGENAR